MELGLCVEEGLSVVLGLGGLDVGLGGVDVGLEGVDVGLGGLGGLEEGEGRGGLVPPFVGVSTCDPSQYTVGPSSARFFKTVLIPVVPGPVQSVDLAALVLSGAGYSMWKTGLFVARKVVYLSHSPSCAHCSFTAKSTIVDTLSMMSMLFLSPMSMLYFAASCCIHWT